MSFSIRAIIQAIAAPDARLICPRSLWQAAMAELCRRGAGRRESGAFLLGLRGEEHRRVVQFIFYDDLDPHCLDSGIVMLDGRAYVRLWDICREKSLRVVADAHTHPGRARQSETDQENPMIAQQGHIALLIPNLARHPVRMDQIGVYEYLGNQQWQDYSGPRARAYFYLERWV
jgi:proteasome lid subunit RPN8/RPN11